MKAPSPAVRAFVALLVARAAFGLYYLASSLRSSPVPWYLPLEHAWVFASEPPAVGMDWFGRTALALLCALACGTAAYAGSRAGAFSRALSRPSVVLGIARAGGLVLLVDFAYFGWILLHRPPSPLPLPAWYCPR